MSSVTVRALNLLAVFTRTEPALTLSQIAHRTQEPISTCHRLLTDLVAWGAVDRYGAIYTVGHRLWRTGLLAPAHINIKDIATPYMQDVLFATRHIVNLQVRAGNEALLVERISGTRTGEPALRIGDITPLHVSAGGKTLLAFADSATQRAALQNMAKFTESTIANEEQLSEELKQIRSQGWAESCGELKEGLNALAVPVQDAQEHTIAALSVVLIQAPLKVGNLLPVLQIAARAIGRQWDTSLQTKPN